MKEFLFLIWCSMSYAQTVRLCLSLDDLVQTPGTRQRPDATTGKSLIRGGQQCIANGDAQSGYRRHVDSTPIREDAGQHHSARSCKAEQPAAVSAGAILGYVGRQRVGQCGQEGCVADCVPLSSHQRLFDAWFMRARLVLPLLSRKMPIIGQARCDTALFLPPDVVLKPGRGRPNICGIKMTPEAIRNLPATEVKLTLYGKEQLVRLRTVVAMARFLKGTLVRAVWCEFYDADKQRWSKARLLLATETE